MPLNLSGRYGTVGEVAKKLGVSTGYIRLLLMQNRVVGAEKVGNSWAIPLPPRILEADQEPRGRKSRLKMAKGA